MYMSYLSRLVRDSISQKRVYNLNLLNINKSKLGVRTSQLTQKIKINSTFRFTSRNDNYSSRTAARRNVINIKFYSKM